VTRDYIADNTNPSAKEFAALPLLQSKPRTLRRESNMESWGTVKLRCPAAALFALLALCCIQDLNSTESRESEQTSFSAEDSSVRKPVPIPQSVLSALSQDTLVSNELEYESKHAEQAPPSWFSASATHLGASREVDLIVMSVGPVHGANVTMFWAFRPTASGHELIFTGGGHELRVLNSRSKGYRDIEALAVTMQKPSRVLYRFNGKQYTPVEGKEQASLKRRRSLL
jgi:hypothetical protein